MFGYNQVARCGCIFIVDKIIEMKERSMKQVRTIRGYTSFILSHIREELNETVVLIQAYSQSHTHIPRALL